MCSLGTRTKNRIRLMAGSDVPTRCSSTMTQQPSSPCVHNHPRLLATRMLARTLSYDGGDTASPHRSWAHFLRFPVCAHSRLSHTFGVIYQSPLTRARKFIVVRTCLQSVLRPYPNLNLRTDCYSDGDADACYYL